MKMNSLNKILALSLLAGNALAFGSLGFAGDVTSQKRNDHETEFLIRGQTARDINNAVLQVKAGLTGTSQVQDPYDLSAPPQTVETSSRLVWSQYGSDTGSLDAQCARGSTTAEDSCTLTLFRPDFSTGLNLFHTPVTDAGVSVLLDLFAKIGVDGAAQGHANVENLSCDTQEYNDTFDGPGAFQCVLVGVSSSN
jgi:hypothetical protein